MRRATRDECHGRTVAGVSTSTATYARDVRVTWWYTASSILFLHLFAALIWSLTVFVDGTVPAFVLNLVGVAGSLASGVLLLIRYRRSPSTTTTTRAAVVWPLVALGVVSAVLMGISAGSLLLGVGFTAQALCLVRWRHGIRLRLVVLLLAVIAAAWFVDATRIHPADTRSAASPCRCSSRCSRR